MTSWPVLQNLPAGIEVLEGSVGVLAVAEHARGDILAAGFGPDGGERLEASGLSGRTRMDEILLFDGSRAVVRRFTHGGLVRVVTGERYANPERPFQELVLSERLRSEGIETPEVLAARATRLKPFGWHLALVTRRVEGVEDLGVVLERRRAGEGRLDGWRATLLAVGDCIGRLHAIGFLHADLHPRNLLLPRTALSEPSAGAPLVRVIDLDRSRFSSPLADRARRRNLSRLARAVSKREERGVPFLTRGDHLRFLRGYYEGFGRARGPREAWREDWRRVRSYGGSTGWLHSMGWRLERLLGRGPEARDGDALVRAAPRDDGAEEPPVAGRK